MENGAYLAVNSNGADNDDEGYFWISYEDFFNESYTVGVIEMSGAPINLARNENVEISLDKTIYNYTGNEITPGVTVKYNGQKYVKDVDYTVEYSDNIEEGTAKVKITGINRFIGSDTKEFTIRKEDIKDYPVTVKSEYTDWISNKYSEYTGGERRPPVQVGVGINILKKDTDYTVEYSNNINAGTATVIIKGFGRFKGITTQTFTINPKEIDSRYVSIELSSDNYTYDGTEKKPEVVVKDSVYRGYDESLTPEKVTLQEEIDYTLTYTNNKNVGTAQVIVTGKGNYTGTKTANFTITGNQITIPSIGNKTYNGAEQSISAGTGYTLKGTTKATNVGTYTATAVLSDKTNTKWSDGTTTDKTITWKVVAYNLSNSTIANIQTQNYTGSEIKPTPAVTVSIPSGKTTTLVNNTDFTYSYTNNKNAGTATVIVTGKGNYTGNKSTTFKIDKKEISGVTTTGNPTSFTYDGTNKKPEVTVKDGDIVLEKDKDYSVGYINNINAGTARVAISGKGNYKGTEYFGYTINPKSITGTTLVLEETSYIYDGQEKTPNVTVKDGSKTLTENTDYTVTYTNNKNIGTAQVTVTGKGNYTGTASKNFYINKPNAKELTVEMVTLNETSFVYDKQVKTPAVTVKDGTKDLIEGTDYTVSYKNNINAGTAQVTVAGQGDYTGTVTKEFTINKADPDYTVPTELVVEYGKTLEDVDLPQGFTWEEELSTSVGNVGVNEFTVKYTPQDTANYNAVVGLKVDLKVNAKSIQNMLIILDETSYVFDGQEKTPNVTVKDGEKDLTIDTDYTVVYTDNVNVGTAQVTVTGKGNYTGTASKTFFINKADAKELTEDMVTLSETSFVYDKQAKTPVVTVKDGTKDLIEGTDYTVTYKNNINAGTAQATVTGKGDYTGAVTKSFVINKADPDYTVPTEIVAAYGKTLGDVELPKGFTWEEELSTSVGEVGNNVFKVKYTPEDISNYNEVTGINVEIIVYQENLDVIIEEYTVKEYDNKNYLEDIVEKTDLNSLKEKVKTTSTIKFYDRDGSLIEDETEKIKTGMKMVISNDYETKEYILIVIGDVTGDGNVDEVDLLKIARYLADFDRNLENEYKYAANIYKDNELDEKDLLKLARILAGLDSFK